MRGVALLSVVASAMLAWPLPLHAQKPPVPVIGLLSTASPASRGGDQVGAFHGEVTKEIPICFTTVTDPVKSGLVKSLNRPGGNATGTAGLTSELDPKRLELLHEMKPTATVIGVLINPNRPGLETQLPELRAAADKMKLKLEIQEATGDRDIDIEAAFQGFASQRVDALLVTADPMFNNRRAQVLALAARHSLPAIYQWREFVTGGGLMSYGPSITEAYRQAGINAGLILKGAKPADIPVVQPTRFQLVINGITAKKLVAAATALRFLLHRVLGARAPPLCSIANIGRDPTQRGGTPSPPRHACCYFSTPITSLANGPHFSFSAR